MRDDGTKITCSNGKFQAIKGRKGKAEEDEEGEPVDSKTNSVFSLHDYLDQHFLLGCEWYGQRYCSGDVIIDLYRWWFKLRLPRQVLIALRI